MDLFPCRFPDTTHCEPHTVEGFIFEICGMFLVESKHFCITTLVTLTVTLTPVFLISLRVC